MNEPAHGVDGRPSQDAAGPRVRFSQDLDSAAAGFVSASEGIRTPNLSITTSSIPVNENDSPTSPRSNSSRRGPVSPLSPRTRDRAFSLRRTLFARGINTQADVNTIEPVEEGPLTGTGVDTIEEGDGKQRKTQPSIIVSPVRELEMNISRIEPSPSVTPSESDFLQRKEKKTFGTVSLPDYEQWARRHMRKNGRLQKARAIWKRILEGKPIPPSKDGRHVDLDASRTIPLIDERTGKHYIGNTIRSSRYTLWNFFPRQLFFQFSKLANAYFLLISILQMIPGWSTTGNYTTIVPLMVFVAISMGKEGYDDIRRYRLDQVENNRMTRIFHPNPSNSERKYTPYRDESMASSLASKALSRGKGHQALSSNDESFAITVSDEEPNSWIPLKWRDVKVGDIIKLMRDDPVPADMVLLHSDGPNGIAYIETMALDGETNLKSKSAPPSLAKRCRSDAEIAACRANIVVEDPNLDLYNFDGRVSVEGETLPLTTNEIIFRGSTLRNTTTAIGLVINSGEECKIRMNANKNPRIKAPAMQIITNKIVVMLVVFVVILALFCTIAYQIWAENTEDHLWYLKDAHVPFVQIIVGFIILFNTLIPLSLYVSLEIIKVFQLVLMGDVEMYDPVSNTPMICNTTTILENLGQVDYVFSDKTGTLTDNVMKFRKLSVAGYALLHDFDLQKDAAKLEQSKLAMERSKKKGKGIARISRKKASKSTSEDQNSAEAAVTPPRASSSIHRSGSFWKSTARPAKAQPEIRTEELIRFFQHKPHSIFTKKARFFLLSLALCHTCLPEVKENGDIEFQAASPDELALVQAAQDLGWLVIDRPSKSITLKYPGGGESNETVTEVYEVLDVIEFSSKRKRMSIIIRFPNGRICIFCKGADSAIMPRLKLAPLAMQKKIEVSRRSSKRKSMEAEQAMRRMSEHSPRNSLSLNRPSMSGPSLPMGRKSIGHGRPSIASSRLQPIRDELDSWLKERETHIDETTPDETEAYRTPRPSMGTLGRMSFASSERRDSTVDEDIDDLIDEALVLDDGAVFERCFQHVDDFASEGLRTLLFGYRFLDEQEYDGWKKIYLDATTSLVDRQKLIENAGEMIEQNFDLAGATAIEDKLQKGVPETIDKLRRANIKIWMLTGDKRETAINIAQSARICKNYSEVIVLDHTTGEVEQRMATALLDISKGAIAHSVVVVDGQTLSEIDANETLKILFFDLAVVADSVICCRASPSQKASLVKRIRTKVSKSITLAIGDGANDIAMIQEAHVGIGISGREGLQAARIADYSIAQFRFLQRLLLVHGRWNYIRTGKYILATFWKELMFYLVQALYQRWTGYTGTSLFESTSLTVFNTLFTSLPVIFLGILEQDLSASTLLAVPELYIIGQRNEGFNIRKYIGWMFMAVCECMIIYFTMFGLYGEALWSRDANLLSMGTLCFTGAVVFINTKLLVIEKHNKTYLTALAWTITVGGWFVWQLFLSGAPVSAKKMRFLYPMKDDFIKGFGRDGLWWLVLFLMIASLILFELGVKSVRKAFWPTDTDLFQELQKDPIIRARFEEVVRRDNAGEGLDGLEMRREAAQKTSAEIQRLREVEIKALLEKPRVMGEYADVVRSPVEVEDHAQSVGIGRSASGSLLTRRKVSVDYQTRVGHDGIEEIEMGSPVTSPTSSRKLSFASGSGSPTMNMPKSRHSVDIAEVLGRKRG